MPSANDSNNFRQAAIVATLRQTHMFADLSSDDINTVAEGCVIRKLSKGETLFREGQKADGFYIAQTGAINVFRLTPDGREQIICIFRAPESFAEVTLATIETYPANAVALESSQVILVKKSFFLELLMHKPKLTLHMIASMSLHLKHLVQTIQDIKGRQIEYRLADWLLRQVPEPIKGRPLIFTLPVSKKVLAGQLGVTSETLSRTFARFRKEGLIRIDGSRIELLQFEGLNAYLEA